MVEEGGESARERRDGGKLIEKHNNIDGKPKGMPSKHSARLMPPHIHTHTELDTY